MSSAATLPPALTTDASVAARWIYCLLRDNDGRLRVTDLKDRTGLTVRGIRKAVVDLEELGYVESRWSTADARERVIVLVDGE
jgi:DNA-binding MarR family transcriptional regulator